MRKKEKIKQYTKKIKDISQTMEDLVWDLVNELRESERRYRSIVTFAADAIVSIDPETKVTSWNQGAEKIFRYYEKEALGRKIDELVAKTQVTHEAEKLSARVIRGQSIKSFEAIRYTKDGEPKNVLISAAPIKNEKNQVEAVSLMYKDITELKQAHNQLVQTEKQATLGIIAGSIGHELNNLVGGILVQAKLLQSHYENPDRVRETNELFLMNLEKIALHAKNLLSLSRPTKPSFEILDLNQVLTETTSTLVLSGILKYFKIEYDLTNKTAYVYGDRHFLEQVFRNLEINAAHAMHQKGTLTLRTLINDKNRHFECIFQDTGAGIPEEIREKIFQPFFTTKSSGEGTGLGLPIVKNIIEQHKGYVRIDSNEKKGTAVTVGIPLAEGK
ncbi:PAS domain S-box protein [candidate division KSB1 bacterium]|nr:PAS domain S-box protein [candidate division KSB1 bacterium]